MATLLYFEGCPVRISVVTLTNLTENFYGFREFFQENTEKVHVFWVMNVSFRSPKLLFIISSLDAIYSEVDVMKEMLDKPCLK